MPNKYLIPFKSALSNYLNQTKRTHYSFQSNEKRIYQSDFLGFFRHSQTVYPAVQELQKKLAEADDEAAKGIIKLHFMDKKNKWNNYSFNHYLLDELYKVESPEDWEKEWKSFDPNPIVYYQGILFRGSAESTAHCFQYGITESTQSEYLEDYIQDMNGSIGVSTTKSFQVAKNYALPTIVTRNEVILATKPVWAESFIYVIDFKGKTAIDLEATFKLREKHSSAELSGNKKEVNIVGTVYSEEILGAFYVNRLGKIKWHVNPYRKEPWDAASLENLLPKEFYNELAKETNPSLSKPVFS